MAYAVTHIIVAIVLIDLYRDYIAKKKFPMWMVLVGGIAGLAPDADIPLSWLISAVGGETVWLHRLFTHSLVFVGGFLLLALLFHLNKKKSITLGKKKISYEYLAILSCVIAFGWFTHIMLDCSFGGDGFLTWFPGFPLGCSHQFSNDVLLGIDAIILLAWLIHEEWARKIKDFI